jgi:hypothetical protein
MGLKRGAIGNTLGGGTHWKLEGNIEGTCREQRKNEKKKKSSTHPKHPKLKNKKNQCTP